MSSRERILGAVRTGLEGRAEGRGAADMLMLHHEDVHGAGV